MATKSTLESANTALRAQNEALMARLEALEKQSTPKAPKTEKPLVSRGYFKRLDEPTGKWVDDTSRPCIIVAVPGAKPRKTSEENFQKELKLHAQMKSAYEAL